MSKVFYNSILFVVATLIISSCNILKKKKKVESPKPDYSKTFFWSALPSKKDSADAVVKGSNMKDKQSTAKVDVFFVHPTNYFLGKTWNADLSDTSVRSKTDRLSSKYQASVFNEVCKVYVPRYRDAKFITYFSGKQTKEQVFNIAYSDVREAFLYYLKNYNKGRPFIIAAHSQGTEHAIRLCKEFFDHDSVLNKKLIAAYLIGSLVCQDTFKILKPCEDPNQTGCYVTWNSVKYGELLLMGKPIKDAICVNPLTWKTNKEQADDSLNKGGVPWTFDKIDPNFADAKIAPNGLLWVHQPSRNKKEYPRVNTLNYHLIEYNLFYMNIRENAKQRVNSYLNKKQ